MSGKGSWVIVFLIIVGLAPIVGLAAIVLGVPGKATIIIFVMISIVAGAVLVVVRMVSTVFKVVIGIVIVGNIIIIVIGLFLFFLAVVIGPIIVGFVVVVPRPAVRGLDLIGRDYGGMDLDGRDLSDPVNGRKRTELNLTRQEFIKFRVGVGKIGKRPHCDE